jgi:hypothetical protein
MVDPSSISDTDLTSHREILEATHGHLENQDPSGVIKRHVESNLKTSFPNYSQVALENKAQRHKWVPYSME